MPAGWRLTGDALACGNLRLAVQRIATSHWQAQGVLRSWGLAPLHRQGGELCVPCGDDEALWLGAWAEPPGGGGAVSLQADAASAAVRIDLPRQQAITALADAQPIARGAAQPRRALLLALMPQGAPARPLALVLLAPAAWSALSGRPWQPLAGPPPRPPRLG